MSEPQDAPATGPALIAERVMRSIVERKLRPGERLGEKELAEVFGVSRTMVREALMQLQARGFVEVRSRQGWYVVEPSFEEADRKSTRLNSSHSQISYAVFCLKKKKKIT